MSTRLYSQDFDSNVLERDFLFSDFPGSYKKLFTANDIWWSSTGMSVESFEDGLNILIGSHPQIEKWVLIDCKSENCRKYGLRFKTTSDKLAFILKYL